MSQENVEILREYLDVWLAGDLKDLGDLSFLDAEIVYEDEILPDHVGETYHGREGFRKAWARAGGAVGKRRGRGRMGTRRRRQLVSAHHGRNAEAGEAGWEAEIRYAYVWTFRDGKVVHCKSYADPAKALEAAGFRITSRPA